MSYSRVTSSMHTYSVCEILLLCPLIDPTLADSLYWVMRSEYIAWYVNIPERNVPTYWLLQKA